MTPSGENTLVTRSRRRLRGNACRASNVYVIALPYSRFVMAVKGGKRPKCAGLADDYVWEIGEQEVVGSPVPVTYLLGYPRSERIVES